MSEQCDRQQKERGIKNDRKRILFFISFGFGKRNSLLLPTLTIICVSK